jgi:beta-lactamase class A
MKRIAWKKVGIGAAIALPVLMIAVQMCYSWQSTMLFAKVDGVAVGGMSRDEAVARVNDEYAAAKVAISFGASKKPYRTPSLKELGVTVASDAVDTVMYPWWLRLVPTSLWWGYAVAGDANSTAGVSKEKIAQYATQQLGESCSVAPKNASAKVEGEKIVRVSAEDGGSCKTEDVVAQLQAVKPNLREPLKVRVPMVPIKPAITNEMADAVIAKAETKLSEGVEVVLGDVKVKLDSVAVRSWLTFDSTGEDLMLAVDAAKAKEPLEESLSSKVTRRAGVATITTYDFVETSRVGGGDGRALNVAGTARNIANYLTNDEARADIAVTIVPAEKKFIRQYSPTDVGLSALMKNFAETHPGTYGVSLIELSGKGRRAGYNQTANYFPASTYKVFIAYSVLKRVEAGTMHWSDTIPSAGGRTLEKCFDDMIVISDNACPEALTLKMGVGAINADLAGIGLTNTRFVGPGQHRATAEDLSIFMASLERGQLSISASSRSKLISALQRNIYRQGIPAGAKGGVADKVGFIDRLLHDTAIVYSPNGTYALTIMTDGSSWANIAQLTREIEALRIQ